MTKPTLDTASFDAELELEQQRAASYRSTADRYRQLLDEATTPELRQYFSVRGIGTRGRGKRLASNSLSGQ